MRRLLHRSRRVAVAVPAHGEAGIDVPFFLDPGEKMCTGGAQRLTLHVRRNDAECYAGTWEIGYCTSLSAYYRFGSETRPSPNPRPGEKDFLAKKIRYICSRLPRFERRTTRDGARSDFFLSAEDGSAEFDLMEPGVLDRMTGYVAGRFDNDLDRILGVYFLSCAPSIARHMSGGHTIMNGAGPLSVIRGNFAGGGGNCGYHSRAFAGLAAHLRIRGRPLLAHTVSVWAHVISGVGWRGSRALMDADVGHLILKPDGSDLATIEELRANPSMLSTAGEGDVARYLTFHDGHVRARRYIPDEHWEGVFPPGAPKA
jgi:hypothetical protein